MTAWISRPPHELCILCIMNYVLWIMYYVLCIMYITILDLLSQCLQLFYRNIWKLSRKQQLTKYGDHFCKACHNLQRFCNNMFHDFRNSKMTIKWWMVYVCKSWLFNKNSGKISKKVAKYQKKVAKYQKKVAKYQNTSIPIFASEGKYFYLK